MEQKKNIKNYDRESLIAELDKLGEKSFRADQLLTGIYANRAESFEDITTLSKELREKLSDTYTFQSFTTYKKQVSEDGSIKYLFKLGDDNAIEAVFMPWFDAEEEGVIRNTLCISSQVGCSLDCKFCATGTLGLTRNLETHEIISQILEIEKDLDTKITNVVFMGMGEPLTNYRNVVKSIRLMTHEKTEMLSRRKITVSTSGVVPKIYQLAEEERPVKLAISLHATTNGFRDEIVPINKRADLTKLMDAVEHYYRTTKLNITYEYIPFDGYNDQFEDAKRLAKISKRVPSRINIIPFNDISFTNPTGISAKLKPTPKERIVDFANEIRTLGGVVTIRDTFGSDIDAACGQLALSERQNS